MTAKCAGIGRVVVAHDQMKYEIQAAKNVYGNSLQARKIAKKPKQKEFCGLLQSASPYLEEISKTFVIDSVLTQL